MQFSEPIKQLRDPSVNPSRHLACCGSVASVTYLYVGRVAYAVIAVSVATRSRIQEYDSKRFIAELVRACRVLH